jgi:hypothetical protein
LRGQEKARISENILYDTVTGFYDYILVVKNIGTKPIAGFFAGPGAFPAGPALYRDAPEPAAPGFAGGAPGGALPAFISNYGGANNPYLPCVNPTPFTPLFPSAPCGLFSPNYHAWGFSVYATPGPGYFARWFNKGITGPFKPNLTTRFDLDSLFGPIPGGAAPDPFTQSTVFGIDDGQGDVSTVIFPQLTDPNPNNSAAPNFGQCDPTQPDCSALTLPADLAGLTDTGFGVPEPASLTLLGTASLLLLSLRRRRRSRVDGRGC